MEKDFLCHVFTGPLWEEGAGEPCLESVTVSITSEAT